MVAPLTLNYTYTSVDEIMRVWSPEAMFLRDDGDTEVDQDVINEATEEINFYLAQFYEESDMANSALIRRWATYMACHFVSERRGNPGYYTAKYERIIAKLEKVQQSGGNLVQIPGLPTRSDMTPSMSNFRIDDRFAVNKTRVQPTISTGGTSANQDSDINAPIWPY